MPRTPPPRRPSVPRPSAPRPSAPQSNAPKPNKPRPIEADLLARAVKAHQAGALDDAQPLYEQVLGLAPEHPDALHLLGLIAHQRGDVARALPLVRRAIAANAAPAAFHNTLGAILLAANAPQEAERAFAAAIGRDPGLAEAHNNRGNALQALGRYTEALDAYDAALRLRPGYAEAAYNAGRALQTLGRTDEAIARFRIAITARPDYVKAHRALADALGERGERAGAADHLARALALAPGDAETLAARAAALERSSALDAALDAAESALRAEPGNLRAAVIAARCERRLGRPEAGLMRIDGLDLSRTDTDARAFATFERAALLDRLGRYDAAYRAYAEANALTLAGPAAAAIDRTAFPRRIDALIQRFTAEWVAGWSPPPPDAGDAPVFLVGFPRSGTTLLDQILDAHPALTTMEEKDALDRVVAALVQAPGGYPEALAALSLEHARTLRALYARAVSGHLGGPPAGRLVDKMPLNIIDAGLIARLYPSAQIILALRHPCDVVLSGLMQPFKPNAAMVHFATLADTARLYAQVMTLWLRYRALLPLDVHPIRYEDLVADTAGEIARLLDFLGLAWDERVLAYADHARGRAIATPSYHQVVQPIYRRSVGRWENYRAAFADVLPLLEPFIAAFGYASDVPGAEPPPP